MLPMVSKRYDGLIKKLVAFLLLLMCLSITPLVQLHTEHVEILILAKNCIFSMSKEMKVNRKIT